MRSLYFSDIEHATINLTKIPIKYIFSEISYKLKYVSYDEPKRGVTTVFELISEPIELKIILSKVSDQDVIDNRQLIIGSFASTNKNLEFYTLLENKIGSDNMRLVLSDTFHNIQSVEVFRHYINYASLDCHMLKEIFSVNNQLSKYLCKLIEESISLNYVEDEPSNVANGE